MKIAKIKNLLILSTISLSSVGTCAVALMTTSCSKEDPNPSTYSLHFDTIPEIRNYHPAIQQNLLSGEHHGNDAVEYLGKHFNAEMACVSI